MNCNVHSNITAVSQCHDCAKGLCVECTNKYSEPICESCFSLRKKRNKRNALVEIGITFLIGLPVGFLLGALMFNSGNTDKCLWTNPYFMMYMGIGLVPGWKTLNRITPQIFLFLPILGWVLYFLLKGVLSLFVGLVAFPVRMVKNILLIIQTQEND